VVREAELEQERGAALVREFQTRRVLIFKLIATSKFCLWLKMSHALLLRLFLAPSFFSVHVALQYLRHYSDNIGITYYLTRRLNEQLDTHELRDVWGFIW
jgi:hypothetical protein